jgi:hypothetical protein
MFMTINARAALINPALERGHDAALAQPLRLRGGLFRHPAPL